MVIFFWDEFYISVVFYKMHGDFADVFYAILCIVSLFVVAGGLFGNIKNNKMALGVFCLFSIIFWLWFLIFFVF